ncbi:hypothetical protein [Halanaeroarchaeum sp. HSR-CO]|nr:hypothetical protein [Halanaeroarchaeum sp. HSR-CO]
MCEGVVQESNCGEQVARDFGEVAVLVGDGRRETVRHTPAVFVPRW